MCNSPHWTSPAGTEKCPECFETSQAPSDTVKSGNSVRDCRDCHLEPGLKKQGIVFLFSIGFLFVMEVIINNNNNELKKHFLMLSMLKTVVL